jgi:hypothetical protein
MQRAKISRSGASAVTRLRALSGRSVRMRVGDVFLFN